MRHSGAITSEARDYLPFEGQQLAYTVYGRGPRTTVLVHGQLLSQRMYAQLALALADRGHQVVTLDVLGHGLSSRPADMWRYSMGNFAEQVVALLDHLEVPQAVVGGASLGANTTLEVAARYPERLRGMLIEMPVLEAGLLGGVLVFTPLLATYVLAAPAVRLVSRAAGLIPSGRFHPLLDLALEILRRDPESGAAAIEGIFFGRIAPERRLRRSFTAPTLVLGHRRDPIHPFSDAGLLASELPNARLVEADSIFELRARPERLTREIADFLDSCWEAPQRRRAKPVARRPVRIRRSA